MKFFYLPTLQLTSIINGSSKRSKFSTSSGCHAEIETSENKSAASLFASDYAKTVTFAKDKNELKALQFTAYGHVADSSSNFTTLFNGEHLDGLTNSYHLGSGRRLYNPLLMRFISPDIFSPFEHGGLNAYAYCLGDPVNLSDPTGEAGARILTAQRLKPRPPKLNKEKHPIAIHSVTMTKPTVREFSENTPIKKTFNRFTNPKHGILSPPKPYDTMPDINYSEPTPSRLPKSLNQMIKKYNELNTITQRDNDIIKTLPPEDGRVKLYVNLVNRKRTLRGEIYRIQNKKADIRQDANP
ncbi:RHS repeat-associated core domain-containing protein [Pseudomonas rustica]